MKSQFYTIFASLLLTACANAPQPIQPPNIPVTDVIQQLKYELALFAQSTEGQTFHYVGGARCGESGLFSMKIKGVEVKLTSEVNDTAGASASLSAPIPVAGITLGPTGGIAGIADNSQTITLNFDPVPGQTTAVVATPGASLSLARALIGLRDQLLAVQSGGQCVKFSSTQTNQISLAFTAERDLTGGIKFNLVVLSIDATTTQKIKSSNTITVNLDLAGSMSMAPGTTK